MTIEEFSVKKPVTISMIISILIVIGGISVSRIGLDMLPKMEFPTLFIMTTYPGVAPEEMENLVTKPCEEAVAAISGVKKMKSFSQEGVSVISLEFEWGTNLDVAAQDIRNALELMKDFLPEDINEPVVMKFSSEMMPVYFTAVTSENLNAFELRKLLRKVVKPRIERGEGVAAVTLMGGEEREVLIKVDRASLESKGLSLGEIAMMVGAQNINMQGGYIEEPHTEHLVRTIGEYQDIKDIENTIIAKGADGNPVYLKDIAEVSLEKAENRSFSEIDGKEGIMLIVNKRSGANPLEVSREIVKKMEEVKKILPEGIVFHKFFDQGEEISKVTSSTSQSAIYGSILAILMILLFLHDYRPTFIIALAIPLSIMAAFIPLYFTGYTLNMITLGGFALGVGMLVDNAIVVIENIYRHMEEGQETDVAAISGTKEVKTAIVASTLTTVVVFIPMLFAGGIPGKIAKALASTVAFSLIGSLFVALTIVPMLASKILKKKAELNARKGKKTITTLKINKWIGEWKEGKIIKQIKSYYEPILQWCIRKTAQMAIIFIAIFAISAFLISLLGSEFFPRGDQPFISMEVILPVGSNISTTNKISSEIHHVVKKIKGVKSFGAWGGLSEANRYDVAFGTAQAGTNYASIGIQLERKNKRNLSSEEITDIIRNSIPELENVRYNFQDMHSQMLGMGSEKSVSIRIFGDEIGKLKDIGNKIADMLHEVRGIRDVNVSLSEGLPEINISIDREKAASAGLSIGQVSSEIKAAMQGQIASRLRKGGDEYNIRVRLKDEQRASENDIRSIPIKTLQRSFVKLSDIATVKRATGPVKIERLNQMRMANVEANTSVERDLGSIIKEVSAKLKHIEKNLPDGYFIEFGGEYEKLMEYIKFFIYAFLLALLLIYMVMAAQFENFVQPLIIMFTIPLCLIGVFLLLFFTGNRFNLPSGLGIIVLIGIAVNNGIILIDFINQLRERGYELEHAIMEGAKTRLRPIFITAGTTVIGMLPMAISKAEGSEVRSPMALAIIGGLLTSTTLTLLFIPSLYAGYVRIENKIKSLRKIKNNPN